jgi:hypothetical protein
LPCSGWSFTEITAPCSVPVFRMGTKPTASGRATAPPRMKTRAFSPTDDLRDARVGTGVQPLVDPHAETPRIGKARLHVAK